MKKYINILLCFVFAMTANADDHTYELKIYRKVPNYLILGLSTFIGGISGALLASLVSLKKPAVAAVIAHTNPSLYRDYRKVMYLIGFLGTSAGFGFLHQMFAYKNKDKPVLIINEKGIWYDGVWFKRNIFCAWDDIKHIAWNKTSSGFLSIDSMDIWSRSHFPFIITTWDLDIDPKKLWNVIKKFYNDKSE